MGDLILRSRQRRRLEGSVPALTRQNASGRVCPSHPRVLNGSQQPARQVFSRFPSPPCAKANDEQRGAPPLFWRRTFLRPWLAKKVINEWAWRVPAKLGSGIWIEV